MRVHKIAFDEQHGQIAANDNGQCRMRVENSLQIANGMKCGKIAGSRGTCGESRIEK